MDTSPLDDRPLRAAPPTGPAGFAGRIIDAALRRPRDLLVLDETCGLTGRGLARQTFQLARALARHGIGAEHRMAIVGPNRAATLVIRYAAGLLGAATVLCPDDGTEAGLAEFVAGVGADVLVVFPATQRRARRAMRAASARMVFSFGPVAGADVDIAAAASAEADDPLADRARADDLCLLVASGATSGASKATRCTFAQWAAVLEGPAEPDRRQLICTPLADIGQLLADRTLAAGGAVVLQDALEPEAALRGRAERTYTHLTLTEPQLGRILDLFGDPGHIDTGERS